MQRLSLICRDDGNRMAGGATVAVGVVYATLMGDPHKATEVATARDPDSVKHMKPKQGTLKRD